MSSFVLGALGTADQEYLDSGILLRQILQHVRPLFITEIQVEGDDP